MADEPPSEYVAFVSMHLDALRRETNRLVGGNTEAAHIYMDVLADIAGHWRRLTWRRRLLGHPHAVRDYMQHRLAVRTKQWRDEQIYEVDVRVLPPPVYAAALYRRGGSMALQKASLIPGTVRVGVLASADAGIAWCQAYRRTQWRAIGRRIVFGLLLIATIIQSMSWLSVDY
ncbi:hypothetical protein KOI35_24485 [Actinoplanes bogorensis]|uniref:Uncharacterized protein n=1 Tax=Paractinoplanes bogorensis TaxID=1610840 RepID=A0ABS5YT88_9ACTN|nr:hypothetical protein [Actinoplanes bogorensis]MBU2666671.1 hypothetical protein [Actinoplanes bogorensis]